jgi:long-chain acyl-CoA synthetase
MHGYAKDPERTAEALIGNGWLRSGDLGTLDAEGFLYVKDRLKDMIISGGENIYCAEVENAIASHEGVDCCAVIGLRDAHWGERVHAIIVPKPGYELTMDILDAHCRELVAGYKIPRSYQFRTEPLPLSAVGKVQKAQLRAEASIGKSS